MKSKLDLPLVIILIICIVASCSKDSSNDDGGGGGGTQLTPLEKQADSLYHNVIEKHFIPVDFYTLHKIDYDQDDNKPEAITDLKKFILRYLTDDVITFKDDGVKKILKIDQMDIRDTIHEKTFEKEWNIGTIKATNEVYLEYLNYTYDIKRYTLDHFNDTSILIHVLWKGQNGDTATLYTLLSKP